MESVTAAKRRLVLHFDVNNTILMSDLAKGLPTEQNLARIVCKSAWGRLTHTPNNEERKHTWELVHDQLTFVEPETPNLLANLPANEEG